MDDALLALCGTKESTCAAGNRFIFQTLNR